MNALVKKFLYVCITVPDLDQALKFYRDVLGFVSTFQTRTDKADGKLLGFQEEEIGLYAHHILTAGADQCDFEGPSGERLRAGAHSEASVTLRAPAAGPPPAGGDERGARSAEASA